MASTVGTMGTLGVALGEGEVCGLGPSNGATQVSAGSNSFCQLQDWALNVGLEIFK